MNKEIILRFLKKFDEKHEELNTIQRCYFSFAAFMSLNIVLSMYFGKESRQSYYILIISSLYLIYAISYDINSLYIKIKDNVFGKCLIALLILISVDVDLILSLKIVNQITGVDPAKFPHTVTLVALLGIPFMVLIGCSIVSAIMIASISLIMMFGLILDEKLKKYLVPGYKEKSSTKIDKITLIFRVAGLGAFTGIVTGSFQPAMPTYEAFISRTARSFLFDHEMYPRFSCNIPENSHAAPIGDGAILLGEKTGEEITFAVRECKISKSS